MTWAQGFPESISHGTPRVASVVSPVLSGVGNLASQTRDYHSRQKQAPRRLLAGPRVRHERPRQQWSRRCQTERTPTADKATTKGRLSSCEVHWGSRRHQKVQRDLPTILVKCLMQHNYSYVALLLYCFYYGYIMMIFDNDAL